MSKYLLLRDNKQTGPHSFEEMLELGFRKYDLVWVEGKSAAWRYPGEINEFAAYAPLVEEQPFDRFFKRPSVEQVAGSRLQVAEEQVQVAGGRLQVAEEKVAGGRLQVAEEQDSGSTGLKHEEVEKRREALIENKQKQNDSKYLPKEKTEPVSELRMAQTAERHRKVAITMPATRRINSPAITPETKKNEPKPEPRYVPVPAAIPVAKLKSGDDDVPVIPLLRIPLRSLTGAYTQYLQYAGVAAALISLLMVGILIGMSISSEPIPPKQPSSQQPSRIAELKEKLAIPSTAQPMEAVNVSGSPDKSAVENKPVTSAVKKASPERAIISPEADHISDAPPPVNSDGKREAAVQTTPPSTTLDISRIDVSLNKYKVNLFGGIDGIEVTVMNRTGVPVDEVVVELRYILSNRNKKYLTETVKFRDLKPGDAKTVPGPKSTRGIKLESYIVSAN